MQVALPQFRFVTPVSGSISRWFKNGLLYVHDHFLPSHRNDYKPHVLSHTALGLMSVLLVSVKVFAVAAFSFAPAVPAFSSAITIRSVVDITNNSRQTFGLPSLQENVVLNSAAQAKANDMLAHGYFAHTAPSGKTPWDFINAAGYNYIAAGENLAVNFTEAENLGEAWMNSPTHKANIVNKTFEEIGVGIATGEYQGHVATFVVQMFGTPVEQKIAVTNVPTKVAGLNSNGYMPEQVPTNTQQAMTAGAEIGMDMVEDLAIQQVNTTMEGANVKISATVSNSAVKVLALFGHKALWLEPRADNVWEGSIPIQKLTGEQLTLKLQAYDLAGATEVAKVASFGNSGDSFTAPGHSGTTEVTILGRSFNPKTFEYTFYLGFVAVLLSCMILAIGTKRHIQHISLIANSSFVAMLAMILWSL